MQPRRYWCLPVGHLRLLRENDHYREMKGKSYRIQCHCHCRASLCESVLRNVIVKVSQNVWGIWGSPAAAEKVFSLLLLWSDLGHSRWQCSQKKDAIGSSSQNNQFMRDCCQTVLVRLWINNNNKKIWFLQMFLQEKLLLWLKLTGILGDQLRLLK